MGGINIFGNGTDIVGWVPEPQRRGTFGILSTCLATILLCIWATLHLSIPSPGSYWRRIGCKLGWMLIALIAPDMIAVLAWFVTQCTFPQEYILFKLLADAVRLLLSLRTQRYEAKQMMRLYNKTFGLEEHPSFWSRAGKRIRHFFRMLLLGGKLSGKSTTEVENPVEKHVTPNDQKRRPWTLAHGFYALMGGFVVGIPALPPERNYLPNPAAEHFFVTQSGLLYLLQSDARNDIPDLSEADVAAKCRANGVAIGLVCFQAIWFFIQWITRIAQGLPISLLELITFVHCICALLIYVLWWDKPFDVKTGTPLQGDSMQSARALQWMATHRTSTTRKLERKLDDLRTYPSSELELIVRPNGEWTGNVNPATQQLNWDLRPRDHKGHLVPWLVLGAGDNLPGTGFQVLPKDRRADDHMKYYYFQSKDGVEKVLPSHFSGIIDTKLDSVAVVRWRLAWQALGRLGNVDKDMFLITKSLSADSSNLPAAALPQLLGAILAGLVYGGFHALAWDANFSSAAEQTLWRLACCSVMAGAVVCIILTGVFVYFDDLHEGSHPNWLKEFFFYKSVFFFLLTGAGALLYVLARAYLVIECFVSLAHMPPGVYQLPRWLSYIPHIS